MRRRSIGRLSGTLCERSCEFKYCTELQAWNGMLDRCASLFAYLSLVSMRQFNWDWRSLLSSVDYLPLSLNTYRRKWNLDTSRNHLWTKKPLPIVTSWNCRWTIGISCKSMESYICELLSVQRELSIPSVNDWHPMCEFQKPYLEYTCVVYDHDNHCLFPWTCYWRFSAKTRAMREQTERHHWRTLDFSCYNQLSFPNTLAVSPWW